MTVKLLDFADKCKAAQYIPVASTVTAPAFAGAGLVAAIDQIARIIFHEIAALFFQIRGNAEAKARHIAQRDEACANLCRSLKLIMRATISALPIVGNLSVYAMDVKQDNKKQAKQINTLTHQKNALEGLGQDRVNQMNTLTQENEKLKKEIEDNKKAIINLNTLLQTQKDSLAETQKLLDKKEQTLKETNAIVNNLQKQKVTQPTEVKKV